MGDGMGNLGAGLAQGLAQGMLVGQENRRKKQQDELNAELLKLKKQELDMTFKKKQAMEQLASSYPQGHPMRMALETGMKATDAIVMSAFTGAGPGAGGQAGTLPNNLALEQLPPIVRGVIADKLGLGYAGVRTIATPQGPVEAVLDKQGNVMKTYPSTVPIGTMEIAGGPTGRQTGMYPSRWSPGMGPPPILGGVPAPVQLRPVETETETGATTRALENPYLGTFADPTGRTARPGGVPVQELQPRQYPQPGPQAMEGGVSGIQQGPPGALQVKPQRLEDHEITDRDGNVWKQKKNRLGQPITEPVLVKPGPQWSLPAVPDKDRTEILKGKRTLAELEFLKQTMKPEYLGLTGKIGEMKDIASGLPGLSNVGDPDRVLFQTTLNRLINTEIHEFGGSALSKQELARKFKDLPRQMSNEKVFGAALDSIVGTIQRMEKETIEFYSKSAKELSEENKAPKKLRYVPGKGVVPVETD